ncbi:MAG: DUF72 domain-containing protein [candidate division WOR-3 bacterium]|nr:DUF72 domain-containing protein [candidate division WOR-3 bacterium]
MEIFVGTSGWYYDWNEDLTLDWYINNSGLNAIELNASFYRFPFPNQIKSWTKKGNRLRWAIKVNRLITHQYKFSPEAFKTWERFFSLFSPLEEFIDYYLFQLPPNLSVRAKEKIELFAKKISIEKKFALEFRHETWFNDEILRWAESLGITVVSIDAPEFSRSIFCTAKNVYLRMHGRTSWYAHNYTKNELQEVAHRILKVKPANIYVFFNNDHNMLKNARDMSVILKNLLRKQEEF